MQPIREELDLGDQKKAFKGKTIKIKKLVKKDNGSFTLKDTVIQAEDSMDTSAMNVDQNVLGQDPHVALGQNNILNYEHHQANTIPADQLEQYNFSKSGQTGSREARV